MRRRARDVEFSVDAYTARLIGRENVSKLEGAVLEIVKMPMMQMQRIFVCIIQKIKTVFILWTMDVA